MRTNRTSRKIERTAVILAALVLVGCQTTADDAAGPVPGQLPSLAQVQMDWQVTEHGPCVVTPPPVALQPMPACSPASTFPGYVFLGVPYLGTALSIGGAIAVSEASACRGDALATLNYNRQVAKLLAQQCMTPSDILEMQGALGRLELLADGPTGEIDPATFEAMKIWHATLDRDQTDFGPTKEFGARVIQSAGPRAAVGRYP